MSGARLDAAVIGGGLIGLSAALALRARGMTVAVFEAESCARHASSASAGGVRSLNRHPAEIPLVRDALARWEGLSAELGRDCGFRRSGQIRVAETEAALEALEARAAMTRSLGYDHEVLLSRRQLSTRVPALAGHCLGALAVEDDGFADPLATSHAYRRAARKAGVEIHEGARVTALAAVNGGVALRIGGKDFAAGAAVNAAGAWGGAVAAQAGDRAPLSAAALQMIVTAPVPSFVDPVIGTEGRKLSLKQTAAGAVVIGGGFAGRIERGRHGPVRGRVVADLAAENLANAVSLFPLLRTARVVRMWAGLEGMAPDGLPLLGPSAALPGLVHAFGFSAHGFALVPIAATLVADIVCGRPNDYALGAFDPGRFPAGPPAASERIPA